MLNTKQVAEALGLSTRTLEDWRLRGAGPRFIRMSPRAVRYSPRRLAEWVAAREQRSTSDTRVGDAHPSD